MSLGSHLNGQYKSRSCFKHQVRRLEPPKPWTNTMSAKMSSSEQYRSDNPSGSDARLGVRCLGRTARLEDIEPNVSERARGCLSSLSMVTAASLLRLGSPCSSVMSVKPLVKLVGRSRWLMFKSRDVDSVSSGDSLVRRCLEEKNFRWNYSTELSISIIELGRLIGGLFA